jgi:xylan 1,4-beta-xylosidase
MVARLHEASAMPERQLPVTWSDGTLGFDVTLPPLGVAAIKLEFASLA